MKRTLRIMFILMLVLFACTQKTSSNVSSIQIIPGDSLLSLNSSRTFTAIALDANGNALNVKNFTWNSSDPSVASINATQGTTGQVNANKLGSSQISASANSVTSPPVNITVLEAASTLSSAGAADLMPVLLLGRKLIAALGVNPAKFAFPKPPLASDFETAPYGSNVTVSGDTADSDGDGIANDATSTFAGTYQHGSQASLTYSGTVRTQDSGPNADVNSEINNLKLEGTLKLESATNAQTYAYTLNGRQRLKNNGTRNTSMTLTSNLTLDLTAFGRESNLEFASSAQFVPDDAENPLAGGTLDWQDTIQVKQSGKQILIERGEGVHLGCGGYDAGRIVILDASSKQNVLEFGPACTDVQFTRDDTKLEPALAGITVSPATAALKYAESQAFSANAITIAGDAIKLTTGITWTSSVPSVATIDSTGLVIAQSTTGTTKITANAAGTTSIPATLSVGAPNIATISVSPLTASIPFKGTQVFTAIAKDALGNNIPGVSFTWSSSAPSIASINANGLATAQSIIGSTTITASAFGKTSNLVVLNVTAPTVATITISPVAASITVGGTQAFTATAKDLNGNTVPGVSFTWTSSQPAASIATTGIATGVSVGTSIITAKSGPITSNQATLTVTAAPNFTLTSTPTPLALSVTRTPPAAATTASFTGTVTAVGGLTGTITYTLEGTVPPGVTLTPIAPVVLGAIAVTSPMTLNVGAGVPANTALTPYNFNLVATSSNLPAIKHTLPITLVVNGP
jgi:uncharacterized protein YjdB